MQYFIESAGGLFILKIDNWKQLLFGEDDFMFLLNVCIRTFIMFVVILVGLRVLGKRGVNQLSVFELGVIVGLGSAAGDPMFYREVGVLTAMAVFVVVVGMYYLLRFLTNKSELVSQAVEGKATILVKDGLLLKKSLKKEAISKPDLYSQLRLKAVIHLGQVKMAILEHTGQISIYLAQKQNTDYGLPILPDLHDKKAIKSLDKTKTLSCRSCGHTQSFEPGDLSACSRCSEHDWLEAVKETEI